LEDARAIIAIDRATFADCPYTAEEIVALEAEPGQYAWVAQEGARVVGYVSAFCTHSLAAWRWEVDELAVHPDAQGRGIGTALVACALEVGARQAGLSEARALVAVDNAASQRVFLKNGFRVADRLDLLALRIAGRMPRPARPGAPLARPVEVGEARALGQMLLGQRGVDGDRVPRARAGVAYRAAVDATRQAVGPVGGLLGGMEWLHVRTLQYEGLWIEMLSVSKGAAEGRLTAAALIGAAIEEAKRNAKMDLVGYLANPRDRELYSAAVGEGMTLVDVYEVFLRKWTKV
jgi:ribosomal protein S18 acetylase RimI-like enzyme